MSFTMCLLSNGLSRLNFPVLKQVQRTFHHSRSLFVQDVTKDHQKAAARFLCYRPRSCFNTIKLSQNVIPKYCHKNKGVTTLQNTSFIQRRGFHVTPKRNIPPLLWILVKPLAKLGAILSGRRARKWWQALPSKKRQDFWGQVRERWYLLVLAGAGLCGLGLAYYNSHVEETPLTGRRRFIAFTHEQFIKIIDVEVESYLETYKDQMLPPDHPIYKRVQQVEKRLVQANPEMSRLMGSISWKCHVIDDPKTINAFVLPTGDVFVFTGVLDFAQNEDQLAIIIAHEMAHALLSHGVEQVSYAQLLDFFIIVAMAAIWCILPTDGISLITQWFYQKMITLMLDMPYSRMLETEADKVGLDLAAKACYDVREASVFWARMGFNDDIKATDDNIPEWLSTHPSSEKRVQLFDFLIPKAIELRSDSQCAALPKTDPRESIKVLSAMVDDHLTAKKSGQNLSKVKMFTPDKPVSKAS